MTPEEYYEVSLHGDLVAQLIDEDEQVVAEQRVPIRFMPGTRHEILKFILDREAVIVACRFRHDDGSYPNTEYFLPAHVAAGDGMELTVPVQPRFILKEND